MNEQGQVVGYREFLSGGAYQWRAFSWTAADGMVDLGGPADGYSVARAVDDTGMVVGTTGSHGFAWTATGGMIDLGGVAGGMSEPVAVNDTAMAVGYDTYFATEDHPEETQQAKVWLLPVNLTASLRFLTDRVSSYGLGDGLTNALTSELGAALESWQRANHGAAVNQLGAFIRSVNGKRGTGLTDIQADKLVHIATGISDAVRNGRAY